jgi:hypothetical protein
MSMVKNQYIFEYTEFATNLQVLRKNSEIMETSRFALVVCNRT